MHNHEWSGAWGEHEDSYGGKEDDAALKNAEDESQSKTGGDGGADDAGVGSSAHQGTLDDGDGDGDILHAEQDIDAKMEAAEQEKKQLWWNKASEKYVITGTIGAWKSEAPGPTNKRRGGFWRWTHQGTGRERVAHTERWWAAAQLGIAQEEHKKRMQLEDNQGQGQGRIRGCSAQKNSDNRWSQGKSHP